MYQTEYNERQDLLLFVLCKVWLVAQVILYPCHGQGGNQVCSPFLNLTDSHLTLDKLHTIATKTFWQFIQEKYPQNWAFNEADSSIRHLASK